MLLPIKINIKPLSVNEAYRGRRFVTDKKLEFNAKMYRLLPDNIQIPDAPYFVHFIFGFSSKNSDWDNAIKSCQDCIANKYKFNDRLIRRGLVDIEIVPKGKEFISFKIETLTK
jgi:hypothetical protein